jgi:NAD(P)-dependent dehydrogenase (short-subunit alcohol dehydrogenase family)
MNIDARTAGHGVDVLVNNAGFALTGPVELLDAADRFTPALLTTLPDRLADTVKRRVLKLT